MTEEIELTTWQSGQTVKAMLLLEAIGDNLTYDVRMARKLCEKIQPGLAEVILGKGPPQPWVAEILGHSPQFRYERKFLRYTRDYEKANSKGSRGVRFCYLIESGKLYQVQEQCSWKRTRRYFCRVLEDGDIQELTEEEVKQWLEQRKSATSASQSLMPHSNA